MLVVRSCRSCLQATRSPVVPSIRRALLSSSRSLLDSPSSSPPPNTSTTPSEPSTSPPRLPKSKEISQLQIKLNEARHTAHLKLKTLLSTLDTNARKQGQALSAAVEAWELERKLRNVGGKINEATGYEEIERLRISVGDKGQFSCSHRIDCEADTLSYKEKLLLDVRTRALNLKKDYAAKVKLRADSQREVNDLLQRKGSWSSADVLR